MKHSNDLSNDRMESQARAVELVEKIAQRVQLRTLLMWTIFVAIPVAELIFWVFIRR